MAADEEPQALFWIISRRNLRFGERDKLLERPARDEVSPKLLSAKTAAAERRMCSMFAS
jgi:hypothetical protein